MKSRVELGMVKASRNNVVVEKRIVNEGKLVIFVE
jgi:hypothetical protein